MRAPTIGSSHHKNAGLSQKTHDAQAAQRLAPRGFGVVARRGLPLHVPAQQRPRDELRVKQHADRREQRGIEDFREHAVGEAELAAVAMSTAYPDEQQGGDLGQEQERCRGAEQRDGALRAPLRPQREELVRRDEVLRRGEDVDGEQGGRKDQENEP
jgi:hypothetical protein